MGERGKRYGRVSVFACKHSMKGCFFLSFCDKQERIKTMKKLLTVLLTLLMIASLLLSAVACKNDAETPQTDGIEDQNGEKTEAEKVWDSATWKENKEFGTGSKTVYVVVKYQEFSVTFTLKTDAEMLGDPLLAHGLIAGEEGAYGLYVKTVNGILADYDIDQSYWSLEQNGQMLFTGVDSTPITDGASYELVYTK